MLATPKFNITVFECGLIRRRVLYKHRGLFLLAVTSKKFFVVFLLVVVHLKFSLVVLAVTKN